jgi:hypothetical protein
MSDTKPHTHGIGPHTRQDVQKQTFQNLMIRIAAMSADFIPSDRMKEWSNLLQDLNIETVATYERPSVETKTASKLTKPIEWREGWMSELPNWPHEHWGGLTSFGTYIVQKEVHGGYLATAFSGSFIVGTSFETPEEAFQACQDDLDDRIREMLV